ncbi:unnamed protein product [Tuber aestivum]|uniref:Myb-like domain-containing protein n=1 Tax=Tuber aestivum TaxID=59557 RepID=A0A292PJD2_9PEZI|nr:unnamed protein product [Tuber aestivum]
MDERDLQALVDGVEVGASACKRESGRVDGGVGQRINGDGGGGGDCKGSDGRGLLALVAESGPLPAEAVTKKRKPRARTNNPKGGWTQPEDDIILDGRKKNKSWQEITNAVNFLKDGGKARTLTAVRLRYQKVLKDRTVELTPEQLEHLRQAKREVEGSEKFRFVAERFKELSKIELSRAICQKILRAEKCELAPAAKSDPEPDPSSSSTTTAATSSSPSFAIHTTTTATATATTT